MDSNFANAIALANVLCIKCHYFMLDFEGDQLHDSVYNCSDITGYMEYWSHRQVIEPFGYGEYRIGTEIANLWEQLWNI